MTETWRNRRNKLSVAAALATVLAASGVGLVEPSSAQAADTATTPAERGDAARHDWARDDDYYHNPHRDVSYVRFRVCPKSDSVAATGTSVTPDPAGVATPGTTTATSTSTAAASSTTHPSTSTATPGPNDDVIAGDPRFVLLPVKKDRAKDYRRELRRELCYDLSEQQLVNADDTTTATTAANAETAPTVITPTTPITPTTTSPAPATGG